MDFAGKMERADAWLKNVQDAERHWRNPHEDRGGQKESSGKIGTP